MAQGSRFRLTVGSPRLAAVLVVCACAVIGCGPKRVSSAPPVPRPFPGGPIPPTAAEPPAVAGVRAPAEGSPAPGAADRAPASLLSTALTLQGTPYVNGGSDPSGFDCSGFVQWVFSRHGLPLPREVKDQWRFGKDVDRDKVRTGDLVFFQTVSKGASHVGIALDGNRFVHAPSSKGVVRVERLASSYWASRWVGARRVL